MISAEAFTFTHLEPHINGTAMLACISLYNDQCMYVCMYGTTVTFRINASSNLVNCINLHSGSAESK